MVFPALGAEEPAGRRTHRGISFENFESSSTDCKSTHRSELTLVALPALPCTLVILPFRGLRLSVVLTMKSWLC